MNPTVTLSDEPLLRPSGNKPKQLRQLLTSGQMLQTPGGFNAISAKIIEQTGFPVVYVSGAGTANGVTGYPDIGMMTLTEFVTHAGYIARSVNIPTIADADTGFGETVNVYRTVMEYERAGVSGIHLEDQVFPKRCGHLDGKAVISQEAMTQKLRAAALARQNPDFLLIARTDARAIDGFDAAINRAVAYLDAGADMIFPEALESAEEFRMFASTLKAQRPNALLMANMTEFGKSPLLSKETLQEAGYHLVIYPMTLFRVMMKAVEDALIQLQQDGAQTGFLDKMTPRSRLYEQIHYTAYELLDKALATGYNEPDSRP